jgi:hypothetical protein
VSEYKRHIEFNTTVITEKDITINLQNIGLNDKDEELRQLRQENDNNKKLDVGRLQAENHEATKRIEELTLKYNSLSQEYTVIKASHDSLYNAAATLKTNHAAVVRTNEEYEFQIKPNTEALERLAIELANVASEKADLQSSLNSEIEELKETMKQKVEGIRIRDETINKQKEELLQNSKTLDFIVKQRGELTKKVESLTEANTYLDATNRRLVHRNESLEADNKSMIMLRNENSELLQNKDSVVKQYEAKLTRMRNDQSEYRKTVEIEHSVHVHDIEAKHNKMVHELERKLNVLTMLLPTKDKAVAQLTEAEVKNHKIHRKMMTNILDEILRINSTKEKIHKTHMEVFNKLAEELLKYREHLKLLTDKDLDRKVYELTNNPKLHNADATLEIVVDEVKIPLKDLHKKLERLTPQLIEQEFKEKYTQVLEDTDKIYSLTMQVHTYFLRKENEIFNPLIVGIRHILAAHKEYEDYLVRLELATKHDIESIKTDMYEDTKYNVLGNQFGFYYGLDEDKTIIYKRGLIKQLESLIEEIKEPTIPNTFNTRATLEKLVKSSSTSINTRSNLNNNNNTLTKSDKNTIEEFIRNRPTSPDRNRDVMHVSNNNTIIPKIDPVKPIRTSANLKRIIDANSEAELKDINSENTVVVTVKNLSSGLETVNPVITTMNTNWKDEVD